MRHDDPLSDRTVQAIVDHVQHQDLPLTVETYRTEAGILGVDIGAHMAESRGASALCRVAFHLATEHGLTAFDPQLGRTVTAADEERILERYAQGSAFSLAVPIAPLPPKQRRLSPGARLWLVVLGFGGLALLLARLLNCALG